jgi:hypothetical protein
MEYDNGIGLGMTDIAKANVLRADGSYDELGISLDLSGMTPSGFRAGGTFHFECVRPDGSTRWVDDAKNAIPNAALDSALNVYLGTSTQITTWYCGLVDNAGFTTFASTDTSASHAGWAENSAYSASTRPTWTPGASSSQSVSNASPMSFVMTATGTMRGAFLVSTNDKSGTDGLLFATAAFTGGNQAFNSGDTLRVTYTVNAQTL